MAPTVLPSDEDVTIEVRPWCNHWDLATEAFCRKPPSRAQGSTEADGRIAHICTDGHDFLWPHLSDSAPPARR